MKKIMAAAWAAAVVLGSGGSLVAHHSLSLFDTEKAVRVKGVIVLFERVNPHSVLFIDQKLPDGETQRWAVDGPSYTQLKRMGFENTTLKAGDVVEVCGHVPKESSGALRTTTVPITINPSGPRSISGRRMNGELMVMPDGRKQKWSDYGQHLCYDSDDSHK